MTAETPTAAKTSTWQPLQVYVMAVICLLMGVALGYLFRGSETPATDRPTAAAAQPTANTGAGDMPTLEQMKRMADKTAEPLLLKLESDPKTPDLLAQIGKIYQSTHQFKEAITYYERSLAIDPKNVGIRNEMASCLYYVGDTDKAIQQLEQSLKDDPQNANSLFNLGMIRWQGKQDAQGAVTVWKRLLKLNPNLEQQKKAEVQKLIAQAGQHGSKPEEASQEF